MQEETGLSTLKDTTSLDFSLMRFFKLISTSTISSLHGRKSQRKVAAIATTTIFNDGLNDATQNINARKRKLTQQIHSQTISTYIIMGRTVSRVASIVRGIIVSLTLPFHELLPTTLASAVATGPDRRPTLPR
jgi:hypothetical protein